MPYYEYACATCGAEVERFFRTIKEGEKFPVVQCAVCGKDSVRKASLPMPPHLYGRPDGYNKPSPLKRHSTKLASAEGNHNT